VTNKIKAYKKGFDYSYTSGAYATIELIKSRPEIVKVVYIHSAYKDDEGLSTLCKARNIPYEYSDRAFGIVNQKENSYVLGVFHKYESKLAIDQPHVVLVSPSDMGNLGTIIRTIAGLGINDLAVVEPAADIWNPKTVRASMGALFCIRHELFQNFDAYATQYRSYRLFPFILGGTVLPEDCPPCRLFSLIFGNESEGLDESFRDVGQSVKIPLSDCVDSFNLAVAVGIGVYVFARKNRLV
jgi:TrmH family RNA methyltransferase